MSETLDKIEKTLDRITVAISELAEGHKKTEAALASFVEKTEAAQQKTEAGLQELKEAMAHTDKRLDGIGVTQGDMAEDLFRRNVQGALEKRGIPIDKMLSNQSSSGFEFDLLGVNGTSIILIEVKARLRAKDIYRFVHKQIPSFRKVFPEYNAHKLMGGIASTVFSKELEQKTEVSGLFTFTQTEEGGASIANSPDFTPMFY